jgi:hypothetical protein
MITTREHLYSGADGILVVQRIRKFGGSRLSTCWSVTSYIDARWRVCC